jgi:hypothetical protein
MAILVLRKPTIWTSFVRIAHLRRDIRSAAFKQDKPATEANAYDTPPTVDVFMVHNAPPGIEFALLSEAIASPTQMGKKPPSIPAVERWRQCQG